MNQANQTIYDLSSTHLVNELNSFLCAFTFSNTIQLIDSFQN